MGSNHKVAILGAGIIGLSTALELQRRFPNCDVTVIADKFNMDTTSDGAAGLFEPSPNFMGPDLETTKEWIRYSYDHYAGLLSENCGVQVINGYNLAKSEKQCAENHYLKPVLPVYKRMSEEELAEIGPGDWKYGIYMSTLVIPNRIFLPWCMQKFKAAGGKVIEKYISSFSELGSEYNTIFNCTGLGARTLCNDMHVIPVRGQTIRIVHNYGHGGYGVTSAPGSARCAVSVFEQSHKASYNGAPT
ncbi:D-aspartate oxidase-like isoform X2 [Diaphorina citri]|uniref:D-aspartate oxidase-like isoform X1 n=1 Tax=Diaphorina citri TaxID=121845 RepID=A0A1S4EL47_DIACI|nr:D-aspartate oxidase-like isoform X1 [Diaphorina citri]XP_026685163.1 D-aspartate oxidase-like isoform X1 [Diaphorina citri]XP_026685164.1 D-aspartate oxidase-like isoform X2 [Diaphorina citri]